MGKPKHLPDEAVRESGTQRCLYPSTALPGEKIVSQSDQGAGDAGSDRPTHETCYYAARREGPGPGLHIYVQHMAGHRTHRRWRKPDQHTANQPKEGERNTPC